MAVPGDHVRVALVAFDAPGDILLVIEGKGRANADVAARLEMTRRALSRGTGLAARFVEVADETLHIGDRHMGALHDLRMARGAAW